MEESTSSVEDVDSPNYKEWMDVIRNEMDSIRNEMHSMAGSKV